MHKLHLTIYHQIKIFIHGKKGHFYFIFIERLICLRILYAIASIKLKKSHLHHVILNFYLKQFLIVFERYIQSLFVVDFTKWDSVKLNGFFRGEFDKESKSYLFLKLLIQFLDRVSDILPNVSYIPPSSYIFFVIWSECLSQYYLVVTSFFPLRFFGFYKNIK